MKIVFLFLLITLVPTVAASELPNFENFICSAVLKEYFSSSIKDRGEFRKTLPDSFEFEGYRYHPQNPKEWKEIQVSKTQVILRQFDGASLLEAIVKSDCKINFYKREFPQEFTIALKDKSTIDVDDSKLSEIIAGDKNKVIFYLWSPSFSYSVAHLPEAESYAHKLGVKFVALLDPRASRTESYKALKEAYKNFEKNKRVNTLHRSIANANELPKSFAGDFYLRFGFNHFPVSYVAHNGKIHPRWITGVMTKKGYQQQVRKLINELK